MNIANNMEAIFFAATVLIGAASVANAGAPLARSAPAAVVTAAPAAPMQVVTVSAKRMTAAEKAAAQ